MDWIVIDVKVNHDALMLNCEAPDELIRSALYHYESPIKPLKANYVYSTCISSETWFRACLMADYHRVDTIALIEKCLSIYLRHHRGV